MGARMRRFLLILTMLLALPALALVAMAPIAMAQTSAAFDDAMDGLDQIMQAGGESDRIYQYLTQTIRTSRALGRNDPDFSIFYAMLADHIRNAELNPVHALQIAEEGLELIAGDPGQTDFSAILQVTRSYALADLGRLEEAYAQAQLILPTYATLFDEATVAGYAADAARWGKGELSDFNTAATDLARDTMERAYALMEQRAYGRVLSVASTALLPMGTGLDEGTVRAINVEAEMLIAKALGQLGRHREAGNAWLRALGYMTATPWTLTEPPDWWGTGLSNDELRSVAFDVFEGLATTAGTMHLDQIERAALAQAADLATTPAARYSVLLRRARLAFSDADPATGIALLNDSLDVARQSGDALDIRVTEFYVALAEARQTRRDTGTFDTAPIIATAEAALAEYRAYLIDNEDFIYESAAVLLVQSDAIGNALDYARRAMAVRRGRLAKRDDTGFGRTQARRDARSVVELFLKSAHVAASEGLDPNLRAPDCEDARGFMGRTVVGR